MTATEGVVRGMKAVDLGGPIAVPVGRATLGRVMNVLGEPVDGLGPVQTEKRYPIHRPAPSLEDQSTELEMFETGIKVVDLFEPYLKGGKDRPLRRRGRRQDGFDSRVDSQRRDEAWRRVGIRRSGRADARRKRPVAGNAGIGRRRSRQFRKITRGADLRTDDGTARRAPARGIDRPDRRGIFPR